MYVCMEDGKTALYWAEKRIKSEVVDLLKASRGRPLLTYSAAQHSKAQFYHPTYMHTVHK